MRERVSRPSNSYREQLAQLKDLRQIFQICRLYKSVLIFSILDHTLFLVLLYLRLLFSSFFQFKNHFALGQNYS